MQNTSQFKFSQPVFSPEQRRRGAAQQAGRQPDQVPAGNREQEARQGGLPRQRPQGEGGDGGGGEASEGGGDAEEDRQASQGHRSLNLCFKTFEAWN